MEARTPFLDRTFVNNYLSLPIEFRNHNKPTTVEQLYYREIFESHFHNKDKIIPYFWMPKYSNVTDSSARKLDIYKEKNKMSKTNLTIDDNC